MKKKKTLEEDHIVKFFRRFNLRQKGMLKIYSEIIAGQEILAKELSNDHLGIKQLKKIAHSMEIYQSIQKDYFGYFENRASFEYAFDDIQERIRTYINLPKIDLVEILATTAYEHELMLHEILYLSATIVHLQNRLNDLNLSQIQLGSSRIKGAALKEILNKAPLLNILEELKKRVQRPLVGYDFLQFIRLVEELHPTMPHPKKARLTKEEKKLPKIQQEEILKEKQSDKWKLPSLRKFFENETGLKATTKK